MDGTHSVVPVYKRMHPQLSRPNEKKSESTCLVRYGREEPLWPTTTKVPTTIKEERERFRGDEYKIMHWK